MELKSGELDCHSKSSIRLYFSKKNIVLFNPDTEHCPIGKYTVYWEHDAFSLTLYIVKYGFLAVHNIIYHIVYNGGVLKPLNKQLYLEDITKFW